MASPDQGFPAHSAQAPSHPDLVGAGRPGAATRRPALALVRLGDRTFVVRTHAERVTRRGRQTLVSVHGRLTWVATHRVQRLPPSGGDLESGEAPAPDEGDSVQDGSAPGAQEETGVAQGDLP